MKAIITNSILFQTGWLCCVLAGANHVPWLGTLSALVIVAWALLIPLLMFLSNRFDGTRSRMLFTSATGWEARV